MEVLAFSTSFFGDQQVFKLILLPPPASAEPFASPGSIPREGLHTACPKRRRAAACKGGNCLASMATAEKMLVIIDLLRCVSIVRKGKTHEKTCGEEVLISQGSLGCKKPRTMGETATPASAIRRGFRHLELSGQDLVRASGSVWGSWLGVKHEGLAPFSGSSYVYERKRNRNKHRGKVVKYTKALSREPGSLIRRCF